MTRNYYKILEIDKNATQEEIKNMSELSAKLKLCQSCRTCENCNDIIKDGTVYYTLDESYKEN